MLVYRDGGRRVDCRGELARLRRAAAAAPRTREASLNFLIELGEFEAAVADALAPARDSLDPISSVLRDATVGAAAAWLGEDTDGDPATGRAPTDGPLAND